MKRFSLKIASVWILLLIGPSLSQEYKLGGYYPSWNQTQFRPDDIQFEHLTHIFHAFVWPESDGSISYENGFFNQQLIALTHQAGRKILLSVGGATDSYGFSPMAADDNARANFISNITALMRQYGYDGIDIDWEFPESETDRSNMVKLMDELRKKLDGMDGLYLLTMAVPVGDWYGKWFRFDVLSYFVDWYNAMTYDFHGSWTNHSGHNAPLYAPSNDYCGSVDEGVRYLMDTRGVSSDKILLGLPFYGRQFNTKGLYQSSTGGDVTYGYKDIVAMIGNGWSYHWDEVSKVPYLTNTSGDKLITYDDTTSIELKCNYATNKNLAGCMIWALGHDALDESQPLLKKAAAVLQITTGIRTETPPAVPINLRLKTFPNPFNGELKIEFQLPREQRVQLSIFNSEGRLIERLVEGITTVGKHSLRWENTDCASGVYYLRLQSETQSMIKKLVLIK